MVACRLVLNPEARRPKPSISAGALLPSESLVSAARSLRERYPDLTVPRLLDGPNGAIVLDETGQLTGSFKVRGAIAKLEALKKSGVTQVVAASAGNHGAGVAFAAALLGVRATVFVPNTAPMVKCQKIAGAAGVTLRSSHAADYDGAEREAKFFAESNGLPFVSPYDDPAIVAGNGMSLGFDLAELLRARFGGVVPDDLCVLAPVGGGGLAVGLACALPEARVYGVQSEASAALALSFERGKAVLELPATSHTWAEGLEGGIAENAYRRARATLAGVFVASELAILEALRYAHKTLGVPAEGSAAVSLCPLLTGALQALRAKPALVVSVLTGRNIDPVKVETL
ncbi:MAG: pyridoxal-phosphate dependent enzyme [Polyangiaceae bacterium]